MVTRRKLLKTLSVLPFAGSLLSVELLNAKGLNEIALRPNVRNFFKELGMMAWNPLLIM